MNITFVGTGNAGHGSSVTYQFFKDNYPVASWKKLGLFNEDFIKDINMHWLKFLPPPKSMHYIMATLYSFVMTAGWSGNGFVIYMFLRCKSLRTPANILIMNLAISDMLMMSEMPIFIFNSIWLGPVLGKTGCRIYGFIGGLSGTASICTLAAVSLNRYYTIKFPLNMRFTKLWANICISIIWIYSGIFSGTPLLDLKTGTYVPEGYLTSCSFEYLSPDPEVKIFILTFFFAAWLVPFTLITFCYINIWKVVLDTRRISKTGHESSRHVKEEEKRRQDIKLAVNILLIIIVWFAAWTPYAVVALLGISDRAEFISPLASMVPALFCKTASCMDPFIYAITNPKFKLEVRKLFGRSSFHQTGSIVSSRQASFEKRRSTRLVVYSCQDSEEVEEEIVAVNNKRIKQSEMGFEKETTTTKF